MSGLNKEGNARLGMGIENRAHLLNDPLCCYVLRGDKDDVSCDCRTLELLAFSFNGY